MDHTTINNEILEIAPNNAYENLSYQLTYNWKNLYIDEKFESLAYEPAL